MIGYILLLIPTAFFAYLLGSLDTLILASNFAFRRSLMRLGKGNMWLSNFRRIYGGRGFIKLLAIELIRDILPILLGSLLLGFKGHSEVGKAFAGFCLVMGRLYPLFYGLKGSHAELCIIVAAFAADSSVGAATLVIMAAVLLVLRYESFATVMGALAAVAVAVLVVDESIIVRLMLFTALAVLIRYIPALLRLFAGKEERISFEEDLTYKLDQ